MHPILLIAEALKAGMLFTLWSGAPGGATGGADGKAHLF